ncbi:hypothetical protein EV714DRAFT_220422 [Schizophyllum commune]
MANSARSPSVQSFASAGSMSLPTTSTPGSPVVSPGTLHEEDAPRVMSATRNATTAKEASQEHRFYLRDGNVRLELDDGTLYNVHRYFFETHAPKLTEDHLGDPERSTPIKLAGVSGVDFQRFLSIVYPTKLGRCDIHTVDEWTSVLRLATRWSIESLRDLAIEEIKPQASPFDKIAIAREFAFGSNWLLPAFVNICERPNWLNRDEAERLGLPTVVEIGRIREEARMVGHTFDMLAAVLASEVLVPGGHDEVQDGSSAPQISPMPPTSPVNVPESTTNTSVSLDAQSSPASSNSSSSPTPLVTVPAGPSQQTTLTEISDQLAYLTLQNAETAEEAKYTGTSINRALFAMHLVRRMKKETSSAALRHRAWRQTRVDSIVRDLASPECLPEKANDLSGLLPGLPEIHDRLASILCSRLPLEELSSGARRPGPSIGAMLVVHFKQSSPTFRESRKLGLERTGWKATYEGHKDLHVSIPEWDCSEEDVPRYST